MNENTDSATVAHISSGPKSRKRNQRRACLSGGNTASAGYPGWLG